MSGQAGGRGYLIQSLICVLDSLNDANKWHSLTIEPDQESEKVDIVWSYNGIRKAVQVKSSQNQIDLPSARNWASELESSAAADEFELRLVGPCSKAVSTVGKIGEVTVPAPESVNVQALTEQAAHKLDRYLSADGSATHLSPFVREILVGAISHRFAMFSTRGDPISRNDFDSLLANWIVELQPPVAPIPLSHKDSRHIRQISAPPRDFIGRNEELERLMHCIHSGARLVGIRGMPGVGKSAFAAKLASTVADSFPSWHIQIDLRGHTMRPRTTVEAMRLVIQAIDPDASIPTETAVVEGLYRSALQAANAILFLENVPDADTLTALDPMSGVLVLFTSRVRFSVPGLSASDLLPLDPESASELLLSISPRISGCAPSVAMLCGCLPLALRVAACSFDERPDIDIEDYVERLTEKRAVLEFAEASIQLSYELLDDQLKTKFCLLSLFPFDFDTKSTAAIWATDVAAADASLGSLLRQSLIEWDDERRRYWMHDLICEFAGESAGEGDLAIAKWRFCEYFRDFCFEVEETYKRGNEYVFEALFRFESERSNLEIAVGWLSSKSQDSNAAQMCVDYVTSTVLLRDLRQHPIERIRWLSMGLEAAERIPDGITALSFLGNIGRAWADLGQIERAMEIHQHSLDAARQFNLRPHECVGHLQVGNMHGLMGNYHEAITSFDSARTIAVEEKNRAWEAHALANAGGAYVKLCEFGTAQEYLVRASEVFAAIGDQLNVSKALVQMGELAMIAGDHSLAVEMCEGSFNIATEIDDPLSMVQTGRSLGKALIAGGNYDRAIAVLKDNIELAKRIGLSRFVFAGLRNLAIAYERNREGEKADSTMEEHQSAARSIDNDETIRAGKKVLADIFSMRGNLAEAIAIYEAELETVRNAENADDEMPVLSSLSKLFERSGEKQKAIVVLERLCEIADQADHPFADKFRKALVDLRNGRE